MSNLLNPTIDYVFKRIFGYVGNEHITTRLLNSILDEKIENVDLDRNTFLLKDFFDDKMGVLDVRSTTNTGVDINIEMQVVKQSYIIKRILYYWSKMYSQNLKSGTNYNVLHKCIVILIADFEIPELESIKKYVTKWAIREKNYGKQLLTDLLEIIIIELPKAHKYTENSELDDWVRFLERPEVINVAEEKNKAIKDAKKILDEISNDEQERYLAELREKHILDTNSNSIYNYQQGLEAGIEKGIEQGIEQGIEKGKILEQQKIAKTMLENKINIETISKITGLTKDEIEKLK